MTKINWKKIKKEYVTGYISHRDLAKKHKISYTTLSNKARAEHWTDERDAYRSRIDSEKDAATNANIESYNASLPIDKKTELAISTQAEFNMKLYHSADLLFNKINEILAMDLPLAPKDLKSISSTLLDLKMLRVTDINEGAKDNKTIVEFVNMDWEDADIVEVVDGNTTT